MIAIMIMIGVAIFLSFIDIKEIKNAKNNTEDKINDNIEDGAGKIRYISVYIGGMIIAIALSIWYNSNAFSIGIANMILQLFNLRG